MEKDDLTEDGVEVVGEEMDIEMEVDRPEYEEWVTEWLTESIRELETSRKYCSSLVEPWYLENENMSLCWWRGWCPKLGKKYRLQGCGRPLLTLTGMFRQEWREGWHC